MRNLNQNEMQAVSGGTYFDPEVAHTVTVTQDMESEYILNVGVHRPTPSLGDTAPSLGVKKKQ